MSRTKNAFEYNEDHEELLLKVIGNIYENPELLEEEK